ncbi:paramyosin-like [Schistocerca americana]|uniref:paramyosin-like n=1 Tax=Schistocerca americana TaxID=7009 RepID=UPI001F500409|nr:paramyosin-like [Schistocerca americana]
MSVICLSRFNAFQTHWLEMLVEQTKEIKDKEIPIKKEIAEVRKSNKKLLLPLREAETTAADRIRRMNHYEKEKLSLKGYRDNCRSAASSVDIQTKAKELHFASFQNEILFLSYFRIMHLRGMKEQKDILKIFRDIYRYQNDDQNLKLVKSMFSKKGGEKTQQYYKVHKGILFRRHNTEPDGWSWLE